MANAEIVIKKYPNRRLYDTSSSAYITLEDVKRMVVERRKVKVVDAKTEEDLTRPTLMQIMLEEEAGGRPVFSEEMLAFMISSYGKAQHGALAPFMDAALKAYVRGAEAVANQSQALKGGGLGAEAMMAASTSAWADVVKAQQSAVENMFESMAKANPWLPKAPRGAGSPKDDGGKR